jgi:hypothetical protein
VFRADSRPLGESTEPHHRRRSSERPRQQCPRSSPIPSSTSDIGIFSYYERSSSLNPNPFCLESVPHSYADSLRPHGEADSLRGPMAAASARKEHIMNDFLDYYSRHLKAVADANALNKPIIFDALAATGLTWRTRSRPGCPAARRLPRIVGHGLDLQKIQWIEGDMITPECLAIF